MEAAGDLPQAVQAFVLQLCKAIASCRCLQRLVQLLQQGVSGLLDPEHDSGQSIDDAEGGGEELAAAHARLLAAAAAGPQQQPDRLQRQLYGSPAFSDLSEVLLTVVAPDWLPRMSQEQREEMFDVWFQRAPAAALLPALVSHLAAVQPSSVRAAGGRARVTAVSADEAAAILAARFAAPGSSGAPELLQHVAAAAAADTTKADAAGAAMQQGGAAGSGRQLQQSWQPEVEGLAAALASLPERAAAVELPALRPDTFVPFLSSTLLELLAAESWLPGAPAAASGAAAGASRAARAAFAADVLARFCRRGHQQHVAAALLRLLPDSAALAASVVAALPDSAALDRLLEAALKAAAAPAAAASSGATKATPAALDASPAADPVARGAAAVLQALVPPATWLGRGDARLLLTDKLLVQRQRGLLPLPALHGLLLFLHRQPAASGSASAAAAAPSLLPSAAALVAQVWGDPAAVQRLAPQQQAFLTAALCGCLRLLGRRELEGHPQLLQLLLGGITARLDSPLLSVRRQAMRVGQALSLLLDPSKPPMFADDDTQLWRLLPEEAWEASLTATAAAAASVARQGSAAADAPDSSQAGGKQSGARAARRAARAARRQQREARRSHAPRDEPEGPLTETDSDDDGGSTVSSSGTEGSTSSGDLEAFDLEESDEEDPARSGLQLRDLPKMLLSQAEKDWKGQLRALRHAEYLIRAAPDELELYAVPLARALVHSKVPAWMDEEMPQGGPPAGMQRFRDVVALLAGAPESAGLALAEEVYGPSMDMYQRAMVLDGMAAAAAEIASPGASLPPLPGLHPAPPPTLAGPIAAKAAAKAAGLSLEQQRLLTTTADGRPRVGTVTRIASRSLAAATRRGRQGGRVNRRAFPPVALKWAAALLRHCDEPRHGVDLLGRDHFLLGKLLVTLGAFLEASSQSSEAATLAAATLELMRCARVHAHPEPFVRRAALLAAGQVLGAVPPARLATAMLGAAGGGVALSSAATARDAADEALVSRLEWLRGWVEGVAVQDTDDSCRMMAEGVHKLQGSLAAGALAALGDGGSQPAPLGGAGLLSLPGPAVGGGLGLSMRLPDIKLP